MHGLSQRADVPQFVQTLTSGGFLPGFQAPGGSPQGFSLENMVKSLIGSGGGVAGAAGGQTAGALTGGGQSGGAMSGQNLSALNSIKALAAGGLHRLSPGSLERLSPSELGLMQSGVEYSGGGLPAWNFEDLLQGYRNAGINQGDPRAA